MNYQFPRITHMNDLLSVIEGNESFVVKTYEDLGLTIVHYFEMGADVFPPIKTEREAFFRECRGITFNTHTGEVMARKLHKFFNLGEREETLSGKVDFTKPHRVFEKLDGSLLNPLLIDGKIIWSTKRGPSTISQPVDEFMANNPHIEAFVRDVISKGMSPQFEWCSRQQKIVIDHPVDRLVLLNIRENESGAYVSYDTRKAWADQFGVEHCALMDFTVDDVKAFMSDAAQVKDMEGYIVEFDDGHMVKVKGDWYREIHGAIDVIKFEKDIVRLIISNKIDDVLPHIADDLRLAIGDFSTYIVSNIKKVASDLYWRVQADYDNLNGGKKRFSDVVKNDYPKHLFSPAFAVWDKIDLADNANIENQIVDFIAGLVLNNTATQGRIDQIRWILGDKTWNDFRKDASTPVD